MSVIWEIYIMHSMVKVKYRPSSSQLSLQHTKYRTILMEWNCQEVITSDYICLYVDLL
jgi:hypothetical protein